VIEFSELLKSYNIRRISGDRYGGEWPRERFRVRGIEYVIADKPKSDLYRDLLPLLNSGRVELLDLPRLADQLTGLERRTARSGKDSIDHAPGMTISPTRSPVHCYSRTPQRPPCGGGRRF
jgi:hypothetical protein